MPGEESKSSADSDLAKELASLKIERKPGKGFQPGAKAPPQTRSAGGGPRERSRLPSVLITIVVLVALLGGGFLLFRSNETKIFAEEVDLTQVTLMSPAGQEVRLVSTGYVYARRRAQVAPKITGRLARLLVDEGDSVKEGQLIAELESADAQAQLAQARAEIAAEKARYQKAQADEKDALIRHDREEKLLASGAGTRASFDDVDMKLKMMTAQLDAQQASVHAAEAKEKAAQVMIENTKVRAPFDGTVIRKLSEVGEVIPIGVLSGNAAPAGVFLIASLNDLEVQADVSESQFDKVRVGTPAEILLDAYPDRRFRGQVSDIRQTVDRAKASVTVKVRFTDNSKGVLPDMAAKVSFLDKPIDPATLGAKPKLAVASDAVVSRDGKTFLFTTQDGLARETPIQIGERRGDMVELTSGPPSGTKVVRHPSERVRDGATIKEKK